jgi:hypothetical protein
VSFAFEKIYHSNATTTTEPSSEPAAAEPIVESAPVDDVVASVEAETTQEADVEVQPETEETSAPTPTKSGKKGKKGKGN